MKEAQGRASHSNAKHSPLYCDKIPTNDPVVTELRPLDVPQPERESTTRERGKPNEKKAHMTCQVRGERKREVSFSYGKCFSYKKFLSNLPAYFWNVPYSKKWLLFHVSSLSVQKGATD